MSLLDILMTKGVISAADTAVIEERAKAFGGDMETALVNFGVSQEDILVGKAEFSGIPVANLEGREVQYDTLKYIPEESAIFYQFVPVRINQISVF